MPDRLPEIEDHNLNGKKKREKMPIRRRNNKSLIG